MAKKFAAILVFCALGGSGFIFWDRSGQSDQSGPPSADVVVSQTEDKLKSLIYDKVGYGVYVSDYQLVHQSGNEYAGVVTVAKDGERQQVPVTVVFDEDGKYLIRCN